MHQYRDIFLALIVYGAFKYTSSIPPLLKSPSWIILGAFGPLAFSVSLFCHPFGGHDTLKKRKIHGETLCIMQKYSGAIPTQVQELMPHCITGKNNFCLTILVRRK